MSQQIEHRVKYENPTVFYLKDLKETYKKNVKECHFSHHGLAMENIIFYKNIMLLCNRFLLLF